MRSKKQIESIIEALEKEYPDAECTLEPEDPYKLLVSVRLAAQCTDERVNKITPALFERYPTPEKMAAAGQTEVESLIRSCGFYHSKARDIIMAAQTLVSNFDGKVPDRMEDLLRLPGVGRKSANLILGDVYNIPGAVVVDTHCIRLSNRMGLVDNLKDPVKIEAELRKLLPPDKSNDFCHRLVLHGRAICSARKPKCENCCVAAFCQTMTGKNE